MASPGDEWDAALSPSGRPVGSGDGGISTKTLTDRLRMLEAEGWLTRHYEPTVPPQVTYEITKKVLESDGVMTELDRIAEQWYGKNAKRG
jgi:DNA-binding HxlR family transcriptional regulator